MNNKINFSIDRIELIDEVSNSQLCLLDVYVCHDGNNSHDMPISLEAIKRSVPTLFGKPLLYAYKNGDFLGHENVQIAAGYFLENNDIRFVEENDKTYLVAKAVLWKMYNPDAYKVFVEDIEKSVSMEIQVLETKDLENGSTEIVDMVFSGVTLLGDSVTPACSGSKASVLKFSEMVEETEKLLELHFGKYDDLDFRIPEGVKENAQRGLDLRKEYSRGGTSVGLGTARYLVKNKVATPEKVRHIASYFPRHAGDNLDQTDPPSNGYIAWNLWGGDAGRRWSEKLVDAMNKRDDESKEKMSVDFEKNSKEEDELMKDETMKQDEQKMTEDKTCESCGKMECECEKGKMSEVDYKSKYEDIEKEMAEMKEKMSVMESEKQEMMKKYEDLETEKQDMSAKFSTLETENSELKIFKANVEEHEKQTKIEFAISEVSDVLNDEQINEWKVKVTEFNTVEEFGNAIKAFAFNLTKSKKNEKDEMLRMSIPSNKEENKTSNSIWERL